MIRVQVSDTSWPSPQGRTALCSAARTASRSCFFPDGAFSQVRRGSVGPPPGSDARLIPPFIRATTWPPACIIAVIRS